MSMENLGPYTNFHELNQDWFLNEFNKVLEQWKAMQKNFDNLQVLLTILKVMCRIILRIWMYRMKLIINWMLCLKMEI